MAVSVTVSFSVTVVVTKTVETLGLTGMTVMPGPSDEEDEVVTGAEAASEDDVLSELEASVAEASVVVVLKLSVDVGSTADGDGVYVVLASATLVSWVLI